MREPAWVHGQALEELKLDGGRVKAGQRQLISRAWDGRRRGQLLISCASKRVKEAMVSEFYTEQRRHERGLCDGDSAPLPPRSKPTASRWSGQPGSAGMRKAARLRSARGGIFRDEITAKETVRRERPYFSVLAFPCGSWSPLQFFATHRDRLQALQAVSMPLITFAARLAREQVKAGRHFVIENPKNSRAWKTPPMQFDF